MIKTRFQSILQTLHFSNNDNGNKTDRSYKIRPVIEHVNKAFAETLSISPFQSDDDKRMCKFKGEGEKQKEKEERKRRKRRKV